MFIFIKSQLNQQNQCAKGAATQDYSFLKEASPIYVTSLTGNHVTGTTTLTTSNLSSSNFNNLQQTSASASDANQSRISQSIVHVHQPPSSTIKIKQPLAGGWLIGESAQGTLITTNDQQVFQNILNNNSNNINNNTSSNNISVSCAGGTVVYSSNSLISASEIATNTALNPSTSSIQSGDSSNLTKYYGNTAITQTTNSSELLANGHGPRREVNIVNLFYRRTL